MPIQHSPPARKTRSWARAQAVLTPTSRAPLDGIPEVPQLRAQLDGGPHMEGEEPSMKEGRGPRRSNYFSGVAGRFPRTSRTIFRGPGEDGEEEEENAVEEEEFDGTEGIPAPVGESQGTGGPTLAQSYQPVSHQFEPSLLAIMQQMTQLMANCQKGLPSRILDQLASHPYRIDSLQDLMDVTLELDTRYHERQKEKTLVGDSRTPSFPSSVHIPSLNFHMLLLSSRDEVLKEIQDVAEDNSVSSLHLFFGNMGLPPSSYHDSLEEFSDEEEEPEEIETVMKVIPSVYHQYLDVFSKVKAAKLPPHCACDHHIELEGSLPPVGVIYSLSNQESAILRASISDNVEKGFIWPSFSSAGAPIPFVKKKDGALHLCVDYHKHNAVTRNKTYPVPPRNQLPTVFNGSSILSKIHLHGSYDLLRMKEGDEHLTDFRTKYGSYEDLFLPFGLTNSHSSFQNLVNDIFYDLLDIEVVRFIKNYSKNISSLTSFLKKDSCFPLNEEALSPFHQLKEAFRTAPVLSHFNPSLPTILETNPSDYALGAVLSQVSYSRKDPIAFDSNKLIPAELSYEINDYELLGIV
ncbi:hypothetical protein O181_018044 [Austropuccinia psidii MF-1]|uniref:Reverse transcriptase/retrotransposon-derived protein RNase H-like domain-containing protein n=1 Tax=Austropuccinia psidii MF-1 TaxID=1389203 RepID=A0A9Q3GTD6_9BASI|nr:hypothetical protein [Austropuccinia psidii MF-1]